MLLSRIGTKLYSLDGLDVKKYCDNCIQNTIKKSFRVCKYFCAFKENMRENIFLDSIIIGNICKHFELKCCAVHDCKETARFFCKDCQKYFCDDHFDYQKEKCVDCITNDN